MARWPRFQLSLRLFLLLVVVLCAGLAWWMAPAMKLRARELAHRELEPRIIGQTRWNEKEEWHRDQAAWLAGLNRPFQISDLTIQNATDEDCERLTQFPELTRLSLVDSQVTDAGMRKLAVLHDLVEVTIESPGVTDELALVIPHWPELLNLHVGQTTCGDKVIQVARTLPSCRFVDGGGTSTDRGLELLLTMPQQNFIELHGDRITGAPLTTTAENLSLLSICLPNARLSPAAQLALGQFKNVSTLHIPATELDPRVIPVLASFVNLYDVELNAGHWSESDVAALVKILPDLEDSDSEDSKFSFLPGRKGANFGKRYLPDPLQPTPPPAPNVFNSYEPAWSKEIPPDMW